MLSSTLSRSTLLRSHRPVISVRHVSRCALPVIYRRSMSSTHDSQRREGTSSNEPARDTSTSANIPTAEEPTIPRVSDDIQSSSQRTSPSEELVSPEQQQTASTKRADSQPPLTKAIDVGDVKERLRTWSEDAALIIRDRADRYTAVAVRSFAELGRELNKVTGYGEIESLKQQVAEQGAFMGSSF